MPNKTNSTGPAVAEMYAGQIRLLGPRNSPSGIFKRIAPAPWEITKTGLAGDHQGDLEHHGGEEKALHHYPREHYASFSADYENLASSLEKAPAFGENISTIGMTENDVCVGDIYRLGTAVLQVSQGRQPCWKLNAKFQIPDMAVSVQKTGRTGWYYRVLETGTVMPGNAFLITERSRPDWPLARLIRLIYSRSLARDDLAEVANMHDLAQSWRDLAARRLQSSRIEDWDSRLSGPQDG